MSAARAALLGLTVLGLAACGGRTGAGPGDPVRIGEAGPDTVRGIVRQVGSTPFARTVIGDSVDGESRTVAVQGPLEPEILRLVGAEVRALGALEAGGTFGAELETAGYEVLSVDGETPAVGILRRREGGWILDAPGRDPLALSSVPPELRRAAGGRVWVLTGETGAVQRYGVLREPGELP